MPRHRLHPSRRYQPHADLDQLAAELHAMLEDPWERTDARLRLASWLCKRARRGFAGYRRAEEGS